MSQPQPGRRSNELDDLKKELGEKKIEKKMEAIKKIIAMLNVGKDVAPLFFPVMKCLEIDSIDMKKLVYLYIIHYSKDKPGDSIAVINLLVKDAKNKSNAIVRALAVRTFGCLRVPELCTYLVEPLGFALDDSDAYVRKNAAMCVPKVYEIDPDLIEQKGIIEKVRKMLETDKNPVVVSSAITALSEINLLRPGKVKILVKNNLENVLAALGETSKWGQVCMLDYLAENPPKESKNAETILDRVLPRLSHINPAVVLSACKVIISYLPLIEKEAIVEGLCKKLAAPLATLVSGDAYENIWVVLRGLQLVVKKYPQIFTDIKIFFIRYQDPSYVKYEKLNMIFSLINERNHEIVLNELNEYAYDMDPEFTTQTVRCIWKTALKISVSLTKVLSILSSVVGNVGEGSGSHFIEEALIGYEQIIRRYPKASNYSQNITAIFQNVGSLVRAEAKVSSLFLLGEYFDVIEDSMTTITEKIESMAEEELPVQLQTLNTAVKIYVNHPDNFIEQLALLFKISSENTDNPDLRDRAFIYWRLLNLNDIPLAKEIILGEKPHTQEDEQTGPITADLAAKLIPQLGTITSILWDTEERLGIEVVPFEGDGPAEDDQPKPEAPKKKKEELEKREMDQEDLLGLDADVSAPPTTNTGKGPSNSHLNDDLLNFDMDSPSPQRAAVQNGGGLLDLGAGTGFGGPSITAAPTGGYLARGPSGNKNPPLEVLLPKTQGGISGKQGLEISGAIGKMPELCLCLSFKNSLMGPIGITGVSFAMSQLGFGLRYQPNSVTIPPNGFQEVRIPINYMGGGQYTSMINLQLQTSYDAYVLAVPVYPHLLTSTGVAASLEDFKAAWPSLQPNQFDPPMIPPVLQNEEAFKTLCRENSITHFSTQNTPQGRKYYLGLKLATNESGFVEITVPSPVVIGGYQAIIKSSSYALAKALIHTFGVILK